MMRIKLYKPTYISKYNGNNITTEVEVQCFKPSVAKEFRKITYEVCLGIE